MIGSNKIKKCIFCAVLLMTILGSASAGCGPNDFRKIRCNAVRISFTILSTNRWVRMPNISGNTKLIAPDGTVIKTESIARRSRQINFFGIFYDEGVTAPRGTVVRVIPRDEKWVDDQWLGKLDVPLTYEPVTRKNSHYTVTVQCVSE